MNHQTTVTAGVVCLAYWKMDKLAKSSTYLLRWHAYWKHASKRINCHNYRNNRLTVKTCTKANYSKGWSSSSTARRTSINYKSHLWWNRNTLTYMTAYVCFTTSLFISELTTFIWIYFILPHQTSAKHPAPSLTCSCRDPRAISQVSCVRPTVSGE